MQQWHEGNRKVVAVVFPATAETTVVDETLSKKGMVIQKRGGFVLFRPRRVRKKVLSANPACCLLPAKGAARPYDTEIPLRLPGGSVVQDVIVARPKLS
jgi:hypothetical protein